MRIFAERNGIALNDIGNVFLTHNVWLFNRGEEDPQNSLTKPHAHMMLGTMSIPMYMLDAEPRQLRGLVSLTVTRNSQGDASNQLSLRSAPLNQPFEQKKELLVDEELQWSAVEMPFVQARRQTD